MEADASEQAALIKRMRKTEPIACNPEVTPRLLKRRIGYETTSASAKTVWSDKEKEMTQRRDEEEEPMIIL